MFTVIVTGGRDYQDRNSVGWNALLKVFEKHPDLLIKHGGSTGADSLASSFCKAMKVPEQVFSAKWETIGAKAGPIRNQEMVASGADWVIAFPGGVGTKDCVRRARYAGIKIWFPMGESK